MHNIPFLYKNNKHIFSYILGFFLVILVNGCTDTLTEPGLNGEPLAMNFDISLPNNKNTRAKTNPLTLKTEFEYGDAVGIYLMSPNDASLKNAHRANIKLTYIDDGTSSGSWEIEEGKDLNYDYELINKSHYTFAYYPYDPNHNPEAYEISVPTNQRDLTDEEFSRILMCQSELSSHNPGNKVSINLKQMFSAIDIVIDSSDNTFSKDNLPIYIKGAAHMASVKVENRYEGLFENPKRIYDESTEVNKDYLTFHKIKDSKDLRYRVILPQQAIPLSTNRSDLPIIIDNRKGISYPIPSNRGVAFETGEIYQMNLNLSDKEIINNTPFFMYEIYVPTSYRKENDLIDWGAGLVLSVFENGKEALIAKINKKIPAYEFRNLQIIGYQDGAFDLNDGRVNYKYLQDNFKDFNYLPSHIYALNEFIKSDISWYVPSVNEILDVKYYLVGVAGTFINNLVVKYFSDLSFLATSTEYKYNPELNPQLKNKKQYYILTDIRGEGYKIEYFPQTIEASVLLIARVK